jgi:cytochrome c nitrite reductase small subunit
MRDPGSPRGQRPGLRSLAVVACLSLGSLVGLGAFTFSYGGGASYLVNDPTACANCHVMQGHLDAWVASSHAAVATCNDCHLSPHPLGKWVTKMDNGFFHSLAFTIGGFPEPIRIKPRNRAVTQRACTHCHANIAHAALASSPAGEPLLCVHCHAAVGHARR